MGTRDPRVDAYIARSAPFARPILARLRAAVHAACPEVQETLKWGAPSFEYEGILCGMAAFREHCAFGFWKHDLVMGDDPKAKEAMGSFGRLRRLADLPPKAQLAGYVKKAMALNEQGVKVARPKRAPKAAVKMHPELAAALARSKRAARTFEAFPPSQKREYLEWIATAKGDETRKRRIAQAIEWMAEGKRRNWKYERRSRA
jgi:uncharacterized protein YdeI (YjbR/CyaY-like superfamily)